MRVVACPRLLFASLILLAACGIDSQDKSGGGGTTTPVDLTGAWQGAFVSASDAKSHAITSLVIVPTSGQSYRFDFDVASEDAEGIYDPEGLFLDTLLDTAPLEAKLDDANEFSISARGGDLVLSGKATKGGGRIDGDWLQVSPVEESGTWSATRVDARD
ncbi:MAG: hypothetical protein U0610_31415 [bacterium]